MTIDLYNSETPLLAYAITDEKSNDFIGTTGFNLLQDNEIEVFYALLPNFWGKGLATEILNNLTEYVCKNFNYRTVVAPITRRNSSSIRVAEKNGFLNYGLKEDPNYKDLIFIFKKEKTEHKTV